MTVHQPKSQISSEGLLDARSQFVLAEIIKEHRRTGEPVGSRAVAESCASSAGWSAPTIRNVMSELEQAGLVEQPHTSAGRVPTDKGYRYYVDHLIGAARLSRIDTDAIDHRLGISHSAAGADTARLMERVSRLLSELSDNVGIVISPSPAENRLLHVEFVALADGGILVVMVFASNVVQNRIVQSYTDENGNTYDISPMQVTGDTDPLSPAGLKRYNAAQDAAKAAQSTAPGAYPKQVKPK